MVFRTNGQSPDKKIIKKCADIILSGGIVIFPTETVYGIGVNGYDEKAIKRLYEAKKRPFDKPLAMHISDAETAKKLGRLDQRASEFISRFMPAPVMLIVARNECVPDIAVSGGDTVGLRFPSNRIFIELSKAAGVPIAATSANISGFESAKDSADLDSLQSIADAVIDGGRCEYSLESTILSLVGEPKILRRGSFPREKIEEVIGKCG